MPRRSSAIDTDAAPAAQRLCHLFLKNLLKHAAHKIANRVAAGSKLRLELRQLRSAMHPAMASSFPVQGMVVCESVRNLP